MIFKTERLQFRELMDTDIEDLYHLLGDSEVMAYCEGALNYLETQAWMASVKKYYTKVGYDFWMVTEVSTGDFIGQIGIIQQEIEGELLDCLAFMIRKDKWGRGYADEGGRGCIKYAFEKKKKKKVYATVEKENKASIKVLGKLGMTFEREANCLNKTVDVYSIRNVY